MHQKRVALLLSVGTVFAGCVSTKTYERAQSETAMCLLNQKAMDQRMDTLAQEKAALIKEKATLAQSAAEKEAELAKMKGTYDDLVGNLKNEISSGQIQV